MESTKVFEMEEDLNGLHEECGVFGIYDFDGGDVASSVYYGPVSYTHLGTGLYAPGEGRSDR